MFQKGRPGETYNIGGGNEWRNIELVHQLCEILAEEVKKEPVFYNKLIQFVTDRPGHDYRYAIESAKIRHEIGWEPQETFKSGLQKAVRWYLKNEKWVESIKSGDYKNWLKNN